MNLRLHSRIALSYVAATGVLVALMLLLVYGVVSSSVYAHLDSDLDAEALEVYHGIVALSDGLVFANPPDWEEREHGVVEVNPVFIQVLDSSGRILKSSPNLDTAALPGVAGIRQEIHRSTTFAGSPVRLVQMPVPSPGGALLGSILVAIPAQEAEIVLRNLRITLLVAFPLALGILFAISNVLAVRNIAPVKKIIATAEEITWKSLDRRIELPRNRDELYRLAATINGLLDRLWEALQRERQFTADASHELRTPLAALRGTLDVLIRRPRSVGHYEDRIRRAIGDVDRMARLVDQLLDLARYDSGRVSPSFEPVPLCECLSEAVARLQPLMAEKHIRLDATRAEGCVVHADRAMTETILENLLSNAIKYSRERGAIRIITLRRERALRCSIRDNGAGMAEPVLSKIFDRFYRGDDARSSSTSGSGLGLAIVKRLAELQGLMLSVESEIGKGTTVHLDFPLSGEALLTREAGEGFNEILSRS